MKNSSLTSTECIEAFVFSIYHSLHISQPSQVSSDILIERTSSKYNIRVYYFDESSEANNLNGFHCIFLNEEQPKQKIWYDFAIGLAHILGHMRDQNDLQISFPISQEWQAEEFASHFCIPSFMLNNLDLPELKYEAVVLIAALFNVEYTFAEARLDKWLLN